MFSFSTIKNYHFQLQQNQLSCTDVVNYYLQRIKSNQVLNAFVEVYEKEACTRAMELDNLRKKGEPLKKLHGVVIAIKDVICFKGHKVSAASGILQNFLSLYTASALQFLLEEDAIIIGNCNCDEFAMGSSNENSFYGNVLNAADHSRVPGGSSGGSAVAVQADLCMLSLGSDTGGSVRQPADFCGIIGLKPGYGSISRYGLIAYASSFDQIGIFGRTIEDVSLLLQVMNKKDLHDSTMNNEPALLTGVNDKNRKYNFCYLKETLEHTSLDTEIASEISAYFQTLRNNGHTVSEINFDLLDYIVPAYYVLTTAEASSNLSRYDGVRFGSVTDKMNDLTDFYFENRTKGFGKEVKRRIMLGTFVLSAGYYDAYYRKAQQVRKLLVTRFDSIFSSYDAVLSPVSPTPAFKAGLKNNDPTATYLADIYTVIANLTGIPAISLPLFSHSYSIPFGIQVMTNRKEELSLLQISDLLINIKNN
ncbi:MAG: Asp-tRNA(Asn)/Glu-tRNA(Gln) amidotransferase subunit GatA [Ferruginibacter sp.]